MGREVAAATTRESARAKLFGTHMRRRVEVGRYVVEKRLGAGAMGEVFLAHDPQLDRKVALKLVAPGVGSQPRANARLLVEAQALAQLDHPHTVPVHDVGTVDDRVWIAMEFIDGCTLREWCAARPRSAAAIVQVFAAAGRGLAAAHASDLLHRDFKPDNVMVSPANAEHPKTVRVTDFGLAAPVHDDAPTEDATEDALAHERTITRAGGLEGTPGYLAPELLAGTRADAASDQFAFCVSLYEALYAVRPFGGRTPSEILHATQVGAIAPTSGSRRVPLWLRRVVVRGLSASPRERFPSMDALVAELVRDRSRGRKVIAVIGLAFATTTALVLGLRSDPCPTDENSLRHVWSDDRREQTRDAFARTGLPYADDTFTHVAAHLDAWSEQWAAARVDACEATNVRGQQSQQRLDLRIACLDAQAVEVRALTDTLALADDDTVRLGARAMASLPAVERCTDAKVLERSVATIVDPERAAAAAVAQQALAEQRALTAVGRYALANEASVRAEAAARASGHGPLLAEVLGSAGTLASRRGELARAEDMLEAAVWEAHASGHDRAAASATAKLVELVGYRTARPERGLEWASHCDALLRRIGGDAELEAARHHGVGLLRDGQGRNADARAEFERALALRRQVFGDEHLAVADTLDLIAGTSIGAGDLADAEAMYAEALALYERLVGPHHPDYAQTLANLGLVAHERDRIDEALRRYREALAILEPALGRDHPEVLIVRNNVVRAELAHGNRDAARSLAIANVDAAERVLGPQHPDTLRAKGTLAQVLEATGDPASGRRILVDAIANGGDNAIIDDMRTHLAQLERAE